MPLFGYLELKSVFNISAKALVRRAYNLSRITKKRYTYLNIEISKKGWNL